MANEDYAPVIGLEKTKVAKWTQDKIRGAIKKVLEGIMEAEAEELLQAKPYERSEGREGLQKRQLSSRRGHKVEGEPGFPGSPSRTGLLCAYSTHWIRTGEALPVKLPLPLYSAVIEFASRQRSFSETLSVAFPLTRVAVPMAVFLPQTFL